MSEEYGDHSSLTDYPIDEDYVDPPAKQRADVNVSAEEIDSYERDPQFLPRKESTDLSHTYGRQPGDSVKDSRGEEIDERRVSDRDDRGGTRTGMDINDAQGYYAKKIIREGKLRTRAGWLRMLQRGHQDSSLPIDNHRMDNNRWIDTFAGKLYLTNYQHGRVEKIINDVKVNHFGPYTSEIVILTAIKVVANEDGREITGEDRFKRLVAAIDSSLDSIQKCERLLREKSSLLSK